MAVKLEFGIFEPMRVDFGLIFEVKFNIDCRVADVFEFDFLLVDVVEGHLKVQLQLVDDQLFTLYQAMLGLLDYFGLVLDILG
jgi:hypothetical protein